MNAKLTEKITTDVVNDWINRLAVIRYRIQEKGDYSNTEKLSELINKVKNREFSIGFCGHFSAGKSSMINELWNENLLPSSPIPTSANLVKVKAGEPWARIYFKNRNPIQFDYPYDIRKVKAYCLDGDEVESVEISHPSTHFPNRVSILDTPGIDSTDDAHRVATTSSLHLADVVFYVMDYNHVQSELNFHFAKEIKEQGKRLYFVINQIDKHHEGELSFSDFKQGVKSAFDNWDINPDGIFYTSLMKRINYNELDELKHFIQSLIAEKDESFIDNIQKAATSIIEEHINWLRAEHAEKRDKLQSTIDTFATSGITDVKAQYEGAIDRKRELNLRIENFEKELKTELAKILKSAILMPFETRELAKSYLEATEEKFKVGFLFSKNKTEAERERRMQVFYTNFMEKVTSQLDWHIKQLLVNEAKRYEINDDALFTSIFNENVEIPVSMLNEQVKSGASVNGDYLLKYTEDVAEEAKKVYRTFVFKIIDKLLEKLQTSVDEELKKLEQTITNNEKVIQALQAEEQLQQDEEDVHSQLLSMLTAQQYALLDEVNTAILSLPEEQQISIVDEEIGESIEEKTADEKRDEQRQSNKKVDEPEPTDNVEKTIQKLKFVAQEVNHIKGLKTVADEMKERANRLENKRYTVALFGAFSAGKSSFSNALIGQNVLPVSPNPTTATINKIMPIDEHHEHGTVVVKMKSEEDLFNDIQASLKFFDEEIESLQNVEKKITTLKPDNLQPKAKPHYAFLKAVERGIAFYRSHAGEEMTIALEEFQSFVADEEKACFVEWIELFYDCPLTQEGITLVDTPGADSVNARHTGVAFEYIKNADAILFVTYYNHAFSHADKEFLMQLGRVKDVFELDKMFFIVNAADLAKSEEELELVLNHVEDNLLQHNIRHPRIFPISSQVALLSKLGQKGELQPEERDRLLDLLAISEEFNNNELFNEGLSTSKIKIFEKAFEKFINIELAGAAMNAANTEIERTIETLSDWISSAKQGEESRNKQRKVAEDIWENVREHIQSLNPTPEKQALLQEIEELFYYVKQRVFLRFKELFQQSFNPAVLQVDNQSMKDKLKVSLKELIDSVEFDLVQEMRATSLRIEAFLSKKITSIFKHSEGVIHDRTSAQFLHPFELAKTAIPDFQESFESLSLTHLNPLLAMFKNPKQFFEQNGQKAMREAMEEAFNKPVDEFLNVNLERFTTYYEYVFNEGLDTLRGQLEKEANDYFEGKLSVLSSDVNVELLETIYNNIKIG